MCMIPIFLMDVDKDIEDDVDRFFDKKMITKSKMLKERDVINVIKDCVNKPKGIVPDSVYELIPNIKF